MSFKVNVQKIPGFPPRGEVPEVWGQGIPDTTRHFLEMNQRAPYVRSTPLTVLDECPRKFLYAFKLGISPKVVSRPLTLGTIAHLVLKALFTGKSETEALSCSEAALRRCQQSLLEAADPAGFLPGGADLKGALEDLEEDYHKARAMALCFWRFNPFDVTKWEVLKAPDGTPLVEVLLEVKVAGLSRPIRTPCDLALLNLETGDVAIVDFKTTSFDPRIRAIPTRISPQLALYRFALQSHLDKWAADGLMPQRQVVQSIHAILKKPTIKYCPDTKDKGGFSSYIERMIQWYKDAEEKNPANPPLVLDPNRFPALVPMTREFWGRLLKYCKAAKAPPNFDVFYKAGEGACLKYNKPCPYMQLCNSAPAMWPDIIRTSFDIRFREDEEEETDV